MLRSLLRLLLREAFHAALEAGTEQNADVKARDLQPALPSLQVRRKDHSGGSH